jgi:hypothetical protein
MVIITLIVTGSLAVLNFFAGAVKAFTPWPKLQKTMPWTETTGKGPAYIAAGAELVGSIAALLPLILANTLDGWDWAVWISLTAVIGLTVIQILAMGVHVKRNELSALRTNITLIILGIAAAGLIIATS